MPIEIKELHIKTVVEAPQKDKEGTSGASPVEVKAIVAQCVEQVMEIINQKAER